MPSSFQRPAAAEHSLIGRMIRAAQIDPSLFAEVEADKHATGQAATVVLLAAFASVANILGEPFPILISGVLAALIGWLLFAYLIYLIGAKFLPEPETKADFGALLRAIGFANAPGIIKLLGIVPELRVWVLFVAMVWVLVATIAAVRHALSYTSSWRAIGVCAIPLLGGQLLILAAISSVTNSPDSNPGMDEPAVVVH